MALEEFETRVGYANVGQLINYPVNDWGDEFGGRFPYTSKPPTVFYYDDFLPIIQNFENVITLWDHFREYDRNNQWTDLTDVVFDLSPAGRYYKIATQIYWIVGGPDVGGIGIGKGGSNTEVEFYFLNGFKAGSDGYIHPGDNSSEIYADISNVTVSNQPFPAPDFISNIVAPNGTYKRGFCFFQESRYDRETQKLEYSDTLRLDIDATTNCRAGVWTYMGNDEYDILPYTFVTPSSWIDNNWTHYFYNELPAYPIPSNAWFNNRRYQIRIPLTSNVSMPLDVNYLEGTSLFGGESVVIDEEGNPYNVPGGGNPTGGGGGGQNRYSNDTLPEGIPNVDLLNSGFVKCFNPTKQELSDFASFLFTGINDNMAVAFKRMLANPLDYIISLNMIHLPLTTGNTEEIGFCGYSSAVTAKVITKQYYEIEYAINITEFWNTALDYSNYTKAKVFIPYCGIYDVNIDEFQNGTMFLHYVIDIISGSCVAMLGTKRQEKDGTWLRAVLYQFNGNCIISIPISASNWQGTFNTILGIASMAIAPSAMATAGMGQAIMGQKVSVQKSGSISSNFGYLGKQHPYIILERPELAIPKDYGHHEGYPANHKRKLSQVHGYTEIKADTLIANGFNGTSEELDLLKQALQEGAYLE